MALPDHRWKDCQTRRAASALIQPAQPLSLHPAPLSYNVYNSPHKCTRNPGVCVGW